MTEALENTFTGIKIGKKDINGLELFNGDTIKIHITKDVSHTGKIFIKIPLSDWNMNLWDA